MSKYLRPLLFLLVLAGLASCVTMNNYRQTKSQMLVAEVELTHRDRVIDSLLDACDSFEWQIARLDSIVVNQHRDINSLSTENSRLKEEYALLMDELKQIETKRNAVQKGSSKTKR